VAIPAALFAAVLLWIFLQTATWLPAAFANPIWGVAAEVLRKPVAASISVDRGLTDLGLLRLITAASVFWLALQLCRDRAAAIRLLASLAAIGAAYSIYGLIVIKTGQIYHLDIPASGGRVSSTFVNHNSFATYAGMSVIVASGLILKLYRAEFIGEGSWRLQLASLIEITGQRGAALLSAGFVALVALLLTGSRGGVISTGVGLLALGAFQWLRNRKRDDRTGLPLLFGLLTMAATLVTFGGSLTANLDERGLADADRMSVYTLTLRSILDAPLRGFGYGTFRDVFPLYRDRSISVLGVWAQAHDTYLEVLQGLGIVFGAMLIGAVALLAIRCAKGALRRRQDAIVPQVAASVACLVGVHALVDFSLQMQAVGLTFMAVLGTGVAQAESSRVALED